MSKSQQQLQSTLDPLYFTMYATTNQDIHQHNTSIHSNTKHVRSRSRKVSKEIDINMLINKAKQHYQNGQLKQSLLYYQQAIKYITSHNNHTKDKNQLSKQIIVSLYYCGTICLAIFQYNKAEIYLKKVINSSVNSSSNYKQNSILLLTICLNKQKKYEQSLKYLDYLCNEVKSVDGLFYRAKLMLKNMCYQKADKDFTQLVQVLHVNTVQARIHMIQAKFYAGKADSKSIQTIDAILYQLMQVQQKQKQQQQLIRKCHNLKCQIFISQRRIADAQKQLNLNIKNKRDSWTLLLQSQISLIKNKLDEQILLLNECITVKDHKRSVVRALQTLVLNSMKNKDFYEAFQYSKRNWYIKIQSKATLSLFKISQAVTFLMKKKYGQALLLIGAIDTQIYKQVYGNFQYICNLHYSALGYAYFSLGQHKDALKMYQKISITNESTDNLAYQYNKKLCLGILAYNQSKIQQSIKLFESSTDHLMRAEPYFFISVILIQKGITGHSLDPDLVTKVIDIIDSGLKVGQNYQMYYYRALLYFYLGMNAQALDDVDRAVEKSEENVARFFYLRGLIFFQQKNYENAIAELTTCLSIDDKYFDAYLQRAKIKLLSDEIQQAFEDLANHPLNSQWQPLFLMHQHEFSKIIAQNLGQQQIKQTANFQLSNFQQAGAAGKVILAIMGQNYQEVRNLLQDAIDINFQIGCLTIDDLFLIKSYCCFKLAMYQQCLIMLDQSQQYLRKRENSMTYGEQDQKKLLAIKLNVIYTHFMNKDVKNATQLCKNLINDVYQGHVYDQLTKLQTYLQKFSNLDNQNGQCIEEDTKLQVFKDNRMLSNNFEFQQINHLKFRYLLPFPKIHIDQLENVPLQECVFQFTIKDIDNRAQAPWMKKDQNGVIFTNKIEIFDNLKLYTQNQAEDQGRQKQREKEKSYNSNSNANSKINVSKNQKQRMKQELQLDAQVLNKLDKLSKIKNKSKTTNVNQVF